jgi:hypothetical protein
MFYCKVDAANRLRSQVRDYEREVE